MFAVAPVSVASKAFSIRPWFLKPRLRTETNSASSTSRTPIAFASWIETQAHSPLVGMYSGSRSCSAVGPGGEVGDAHRARRVEGAVVGRPALVGDEQVALVLGRGDHVRQRSRREGGEVRSLLRVEDDDLARFADFGGLDRDGHRAQVREV